MSIQIRRGTNADRALITPAEGELIYTTDSKVLYVGDGSTLGGNQVSTAGVLLGTLSGDIGLNNFNITGTGLEINGSNGAITATSFTGSINGSLGSNLTTGTRSITNGSNLTINGSNGAITATSFTGSIKGSLGSNLTIGTKSITNGSNLTINGSNGTITATTIAVNDVTTSKILPTDSTISLGDETNTTGISVNLTSGSGLYVHSALDNQGNVPLIGINGYKGTLQAKTTVVNGDVLGGYCFNAYNGVRLAQSISMFALVNDQSITNSSTDIKSDLYIGMGPDIQAGIGKYAKIKAGGDFTANTVTVNQFATGSLPSSPVKGMIAFDSTTNQFKGWNGTAWAVLG